MYQIVCDRCGNVFEGTDTLPALFADKCSGIDIAYHSDWESKMSKVTEHKNKKQNEKCI